MRRLRHSADTMDEVTPGDEDDPAGVSLKKPSKFVNI